MKPLTPDPICTDITYIKSFFFTLNLDYGIVPKKK